MSKMASKKTTVKQKAFTLIELMAVVIILGIISTVAVSAINTSIRNSKEKLYVEQIGRLEKGVEKWAVDNTTRLPIDNSGIVFFSVDSLKDEGIVDSDSIVDPRTDEQLQGCVTIKYETAYQQYSYDYIDDDCSTVSNAYKPVIFIGGGDSQFLEVNSVYELPVASAKDYTGLTLKVSGPIIKKDDNIVTSIDSSTIGDVYTLTYMATDERLGLSQTKEITLTVNDTIAPVIVVNGSAVSASTTFEASPIFTPPTSTITDNSCGVSGTDTTKNGCASTLTPIVSSSLLPQVPGTYNVTFRAEDSSGNTKFLIVSVTVVDTIAPAAPTFALKHNNSSGANYGETWTGTDVWVGNLAAVENGSGVAKYQYAVDCTGTWTDITTKTYNTETNQQICIKAIDNVGNESTPSRLITIRVDKTAPTCASSGGSTAWTNGSRVITGACSSDTGSGCNPAITVSQTYSSEINTTTAGPGAGLIRDNAGNTASCPANQTVRIDKTAPTCSASTGGNTAWTNGSRVISGTCSDTGGSGCSGTTISTTYSTEVNTTTASAGSGTFTDNAGNSASVTCPGTQTVRIDKTAPAIANGSSGTILYGDPNFASGTNSINIYNNLGNGTVTHSRVALATPEGSYALQITTSGSASPGHGGFYFGTPTSASKVFFTRIVARIPAGYTINWGSNAIGGGSVTWLTSQAGTGAWEEYLVRVNVGTDGNYSSTNFFYLTGGAAPVTWHVAYATVHDTTRWGTTNNITSTSTDSGSGITGYGYNQSSVTAPTYKTVTATSEVAPSFNGLTANGTHYIWVRDAAGNQSNMAVSVSYIDRTAPTCTSSGGDAAWTSGNRTITGTCSDSQSGCTGNASTTHSASINTTTASPGTVYDNVGNSVACPANQTVRIDKTAPTTPTISLNGYTSGAWTNGNVTITASSSDDHSGISSYEYSHDQVGVTAMSNPWTITWGGQWTFYVRSVDAAGNRSGWSTGFVLRIDKTPPSGTITSPNSAGTWYTTDIPVTFTPSDDNGVSSWRINWANGGVWAGWGAYRYTANYSEPFTGEGVRQAQMEVTDIAGNVSYITSGTYYLDKSNPYTSFSSSYSVETWYNSNISITMTPRDSVSGVNRYNYTFYNGASAGTSYGYYYDATARSDVFDGDGIRKMRSIVYDNAGRSGTSWSNEYWRDTVKPSLTPSCAYYPKTEQMRIYFSDASSGMASADASAGGFGYAAGTSYAYRTTVFSGSTLNVTYRYAKDKAGNETSSSTAVNCAVSYTY